VKNVGGKVAQDLHLLTDSDGLYSLERPGEPTKNDKFANAIVLGNLHPDSELAVSTWNTIPAPILPSGKWKVTYLDGSIPVEFPTPTLAYMMFEHPYKIGGIIDAGLIFITFFAVFLGFTLGRYSRRVRIKNSESGLEQVDILD
jgi:hypothetical protein